MEVSQSRLTGWGLGLREEHIPDILQSAPGNLPVFWFEIITENYLSVGGKRRRELEAIRARYPVTMHGVSLSLGSRDPIDTVYLQSLKKLADELDPSYVSDHLSWTRWQNQTSFDLLPLPYTRESLDHLSERIDQVQEYLGRRFYIENPSAYVAFRDQDYSEGSFLAELVRRTGCGLILDVNNLYINQHNLGFNAIETLFMLDPDTIGYIHIAGHSIHPDLPNVRVDTHGSEVMPEVAQLLKIASEVIGPKPIMLERDENIPPLSELLEEVRALGKLARTGEASKFPKVEHCLSLQNSTWAPKLELLQEHFFHTLRSQRAGLEYELQKLGSTEPDSGVRVYRDAYQARILEALRGIFPCLHHILGEDLFCAVGRDFIGGTIFRDHNIRAVGQGFPEFVQSRPNILESCENQLLADIAAIEGALADLYDGPDVQKPLDTSVLGGIPEAAMASVTLSLLPYKSLSLKYPAYQITESFAEGKLIPTPPPPNPVWLLYCRDSTTLAIRKYQLSRDELYLVNDLAKGKTLEDAAKRVGNNVTIFSETLLKLFNFGLINEVRWP